jgi:hypothetical protein
MAAVPPQTLRPDAAETHSQTSLQSQARSGPSPGRVAQIALAFGIAIAVLSQGINAPFIKDAEPQSAQWIADIVDNGHWLLPHDYYHLVNRKPPLFYWLSALVTKTTGGRVDEVRARAVSLVAGAALAAEVMVWTATRLGTCGGWLAFVFLLGTYGFAARATVALTDMLLTLLLFSSYIILMPAIVALAEGSGERRGRKPAASRWRTAAAGMLLGLAILTKGPVAAVLLILAVPIYLLLIRANPLVPLMRAWPWAVLALSLVVACTWYLPAFIAGGSAYLGGVVFQENLGHFLPAIAGGTGEAARPIYYVALRMIGGSLPLSLLIPAVAVSCVTYARDARRDLQYQLAMLLAVLLLFSLASTKRDDYILPALPSIAILFTAQFVLLGEGTNGNRRLAAIFRDTAVAGSAATVLLSTLVIFIFIRSGGRLHMLDGRFASSDASYAAIFAYGIARTKFSFAFFGFFMITGAGAAIAGVYDSRPLVSGAGLGLLCLAGSTLWIGTVKPLEASTRSVAGFVATVRAEVGQAPVYVSHPDPEMAWYYGRALPTIPRLIELSGPSSGLRTYFVGRRADLILFAPPVRQHLKLMLQSHVQGAGGPPALYLLESLK